MTNIDKAIEQLNKILPGIIDFVEKEKIMKSKRIKLNVLGLDISTNFSLSNFDDSLSPTPRTAYKKSDDSDSLIDVLEDDRFLKIVALLPGVKKEDVKCNVRDGLIELEIYRDSQLIRKSIPCKVKPDYVTLNSISVKNSVLEMIFKKTQTQ